ncbi:twin-arginine translocase subunit TatC [Agrococcus jejuensis]|uniref:Sec-independent protein translocase protein TatC n=1 Tax=Agrococcus jejuensis TaxID=399736 RepID=A0A1G8F1F5_9MICO|nr:twin-arginine translocase subunit TatC [Agrococcus jejuensis]SDH75976.1 sec-independent protein translocase protein TatC [Agrococcus jejuensis]
MTATTADAPRLTLGQHLRDARAALVRSTIAFAVAAVVGCLVSDAVLDVLRAPILEIAQTRDASLNYDSVTGAFDLRLRIAVLAGIVLAAPWWLVEAVRYVGPGLTRRERRAALGTIAAAVPLFAAGCAMGLALFPHMVELLAGFAGDGDTTVLLASTYVDFVLKIVVATGVAFVVPVVIVLLNALGVLPAATLARGWRLCVVAIVVFSALATPAADVLSMLLVALPMTALWAAALGIAWLHDRRIARRARADAPAREEVLA